MIANLRYEMFKLLSVRSTYVASILALLFSGLVVITHIVDYKGLPGDLKTDSLASVMLDTPIAAAMIAAVIAILFVIHEYRYNTVAYTLVGSRSRTKALLAKLVSVFSYAALLGALCVGLGMACYYIGLTARGAEIPAQNFDVLATFVRSVGYVVGMALFGMLFAVLARNIVMAVVGIFILPLAVEPLLGVLLKDNIAYLPFTALTQIVMPAGAPDTLVSPARGALIFSGYLVVGWIIAWLLFLRRDAN